MIDRMRHSKLRSAACLMIGLLVAGECSAAVQPAAADANPLERAVKGMRTAGERISTRDTSEVTRGIQRQVVNDLKQLIEMARQQHNQPPQQRRQSQQQSQQQPQAGEGGEQPRPDQESQPAPAADSGNSNQNRQNPEDSEERAGHASDEQVQTLIQRRLVDEVWGHLPARLRQKLQNISSEKALPRYEELIRRYFEALAEENPASGAR